MSVTLVYLSGPMTGLPDFGYPAFDAAAADLRSRGYRVLNPADFGAAPHLEWGDLVARDLAHLANVNVVAQMDGWEQSRGARLEAHVAKAFGKPVVPLASLLG